MKVTISIFAEAREKRGVFSKNKQRSQFSFLPYFSFSHAHTCLTDKARSKIAKKKHFLLHYSQPGRIMARQDFHKRVWVHEVFIPVLQTWKAQIKIWTFKRQTTVSIHPNEDINHVNAASKALCYYYCWLKVYFSLHISYVDRCAGLQKSCIYGNGSDRFAKKLKYVCRSIIYLLLIFWWKELMLKCIGPKENYSLRK